MNLKENDQRTKGLDSLLNAETVKYFSMEDWETERYKNGLCMTVTPEVDPDGNRNVWTLPDSDLQPDNLEAYDFVLEGNDDDEYNDDCLATVYWKVMARLVNGTWQPGWS